MSRERQRAAQHPQRHSPRTSSSSSALSPLTRNEASTPRQRSSSSRRLPHPATNPRKTKDSKCTSRRTARTSPSNSTSRQRCVRKSKKTPSPPALRSPPSTSRLPKPWKRRRSTTDVHVPSGAFKRLEARLEGSAREIEDLRMQLLEMQANGGEGEVRRVAGSSSPKLRRRTSRMIRSRRSTRASTASSSRRLSKAQTQVREKREGSQRVDQGTTVSSRRKSVDGMRKRKEVHLRSVYELAEDWEELEEKFLITLVVALKSDREIEECRRRKKEPGRRKSVEPRLDSNDATDLVDKHKMILDLFFLLEVELKKHYGRMRRRLLPSLRGQERGGAVSTEDSDRFAGFAHWYFLTTREKFVRRLLRTIRNRTKGSDQVTPPSHYIESKTTAQAHWNLPCLKRLFRDVVGIGILELLYMLIHRGAMFATSDRGPSLGVGFYNQNTQLCFGIVEDEDMESRSRSMVTSILAPGLVRCANPGRFLKRTRVLLDGTEVEDAARAIALDAKVDEILQERRTAQRKKKAALVAAAAAGDAPPRTAHDDWLANFVGGLKPNFRRGMSSPLFPEPTLEEEKETK